MTPHTPETDRPVTLTDLFDRPIRYLRLSVTDRCDLRCLYCMGDDPEFLPRSDLLTLEDLDRLAGVFISLGIRKIRLTGGEPLARRGIISLVEALGRRLSADGLHELTMTTNGTQLARHADALAQAGIRRLNVSLDSLDADTFATLTRSPRLDAVLSGISAAVKAGLSIKINMVVVRGVNDHQIDPMIIWCGQNGFDLCLIETMPLGGSDAERAAQYQPLDSIRQDLSQRWTLTPHHGESDRGLSGPARFMQIAETGQRLGFITPMSHGFCDSCNRVRLTCTGRLHLCLGHEDGIDLRPGLLATEGENSLRQAILRAISVKPKSHDFIIGDGTSPTNRRMHQTGG